MGKIVFAGAMSHVLDPDYYDRACGAIGRRMITETMTAIAHIAGDQAAPERRLDRRQLVAEILIDAPAFAGIDQQ